MKYCLTIVFPFLLAGCASMSADRVGTSAWHDLRMSEIDQAYDAWEIDEADYLELKNEADQIRSEYLDRLEERRRRNPVYVGIGFGHHGHHRHHRYYGHYDHW